MTLLVMPAMVIGAMLGLRFKVLILVPATVIGSAATLGAGMTHSNSLWSILLAMVLVISALQMGYLGGAVIRFVSGGRGSTRIRLGSSRRYNGPLAEPTLMLHRRALWRGPPSGRI
jgi:hypothetical protein